MNILSFFLLISKGIVSKIDTLESVEEYLDFDLFLCGSLLIEDFCCFEELNRPCKLNLATLKDRKRILFKELGLPIYNMKEHTQDEEDDSYLLEHIKKVREKKLDKDVEQGLKNFIRENFLEAFKNEADFFTGYEEFNSPCIIMDEIKNEHLRQLTEALHNRWQILSKRDKDLRKFVSSRIDLMHPYIVPGGRFQEFFYWDTWFVLEGLVKTQCHNAAFNIVKNITSMIEKYGFMPNGTRKYFLNRSQPPFYCKMLQSLSKFHCPEIDRFVIKKGLSSAIKELEFFETKRKINFTFQGRRVEMFRYFVSTDYFRLESLKDDLETFEKALKHYGKDATYGFQKRIFSCLKSAAESGIDFSNRWFAEKNRIETIESSGYVSPDLNALIYFNYVFIAKLLEENDEKIQSKKFFRRAEELKQNINSILWNEKEKCWFDYNTENEKQRIDSFRPCYFFPIFFGIEPPTCSDHEIILKYSDEIFGYVGGIPASSWKDQPVSQQWDYPNVWAPYNYLFYEMFAKKYPHNEALKYHVAKCFYNSVKSNYFRSDSFGIFYEKYCCNTHDKTGSGGEYPTQDGFGWTNGTTLCLIKDFGDKLEDYFDQEISKQEIVKYLQKTVDTMKPVVLPQAQLHLKSAITCQKYPLQGKLESSINHMSRTNGFRSHD